MSEKTIDELEVVKVGLGSGSPRFAGVDVGMPHRARDYAERVSVTPAMVLRVIDTLETENKALLEEIEDMRQTKDCDDKEREVFAARKGREISELLKRIDKLNPQPKP